MSELAAEQFTPEIYDLACVYIPVADVYTSTLWYHKHLGFSHAEGIPVVPGMHHAILLYPSKGPAVFLIKNDEQETNVFRDSEGPEMASLCFAVTGIDQMYERLKLGGV